MRKVMTLSFGLLLLFSLSGAVYAQEADQPSDVQPEVVQENPDAEPIEINLDEANEEVVAESETTFVIYVEDSCPHCRDVKEFVRVNELENEIEYIDLTNNDENYELLKSEWDRLGLDELGWPFMVYTIDGEEDYASGSTPIIDVLAEEFDIEQTEVEGEEDSSNMLLIVLGGVFFLAIIGYGVYSFVAKKDE